MAKEINILELTNKENNYFLQALIASGIGLIKIDTNHQALDASENFAGIARDLGITAPALQKVLARLKLSSTPTVIDLKSYLGIEGWIEAGFIATGQTGYLVTVKNITATMLQLQAAAESRWFLEQMANHLPETIIVIRDLNPPEEILFSSVSVASVWEYLEGAGEANTQQLLPLIIGAMPFEYRQKFVNLSMNKEDGSLVTPLHFRDGTTRWMSIRKHIVSSTEGRSYSISITTDVTAAMQLQEQLDQAKVWNEGLVSHMPDEIYRFSHLGELLNKNNESTSLLRLLDKEHLESLQQTVSRVCETGSPQVQNIKLDLDGEIRLLEMRVFAPEAHPSSSALLVLRDMTEINNVYEARLKREVNWVMQCLATVAHDLRNSLSSLAIAPGVIKRLLDKDSHLTENLKDQLNKMTKKIHALDEMIGIYKYLAQAHKSGKVDLNIQEIDLITLVEGVLQDNEEITKKHSLEVINHSAQIYMWADPKLLRHVIINLLSNAAKYSRPGSTIKLEIGQTDNLMAFVNVSDEGVGMSKEDADRIFTPFFRAEQAVKSGVNGTGLGLHITQMCIHAHEGKISVISAPERGSTFSVELPLTHA